MATIYPFRALRPVPKLAAQVASVPYDVVNCDEAAKLAFNNPYSFLHVTRPEIDLATDIDPHSEAVYKKGAQALTALRDNHILIQDEQPCLYAYQLIMGSHKQTGVVLCAAVSDYEQNIIRKHEFTRPDKENDRVRHMQALGAQTGKVFLCHKDSETIAQELKQVTANEPVYDFIAEDGVQHRLWVIDNSDSIANIVSAFAAAGDIYIADGHHRSAAAARFAQYRRVAGAVPDSQQEYERFLAVSFPASEMQILPYNRIAKDLAGMSTADFLNSVRERFIVSDSKPITTKPQQFCMYLENKWYCLEVRPGSWDDTDKVARLDVSLLQQQLLAPLLGISDPRRDQRIDFVGGIRGDAELERRVQHGWAVAFKMHPTSISDLFAIADAGCVMPPKSTWFEPKLRDGLVVHCL
ncbi:MAG: DUF1015 domain-containing protein [Deltaproteobacteria bacterium]|nr:DUF1015 domain-containing protein [Deltaproteobacteria bacterium]